MNKKRFGFILTLALCTALPSKIGFSDFVIEDTADQLVTDSGLIIVTDDHSVSTVDKFKKQTWLWSEK